MKNKLNELTDKSLELCELINNVDVLTNDIYNESVNFNIHIDNVLIKHYLKANEARVSIARRLVVELIQMAKELHKDIAELTDNLADNVN